MLMDQNLLIKSQAKKMKYDKNVQENIKNALNTFMKGEIGRFGNYVATKNALVYRTVSTVDGYNQEVICLRLIQDGKVYYLGNSSKLMFVETKIAFGQRTTTWGISKIQDILSKNGIPMLPFQAFKEANLKLTYAEILDQTKSETVRRKIGVRNNKNQYEDVHFTGASLFKIGEKRFLFDIDRAEIEHGIFNPFIVELNPNAQVDTVKLAYESLVPSEIKEAIATGKTVKRQGEYFFVKIADCKKYKADLGRSNWEFGDTYAGYQSASLTAQGNRDHICSLFNKEYGLVSGLVTHAGREHKDLNLVDGWYKPVPNTAVRSFTITGDVD